MSLVVHLMTYCDDGVLPPRTMVANAAKTCSRKDLPAHAVMAAHWQSGCPLSSGYPGMHDDEAGPDATSEHFSAARHDQTGMIARGRGNR